jgi:hypothetical protein
MSPRAKSAAIIVLKVMSFPFLLLLFLLLLFWIALISIGLFARKLLLRRATSE